MAAEEDGGAVCVQALEELRRKLAANPGVACPAIAVASWQGHEGNALPQKLQNSKRRSATGVA